MIRPLIEHVRARSSSISPELALGLQWWAEVLQMCIKWLLCIVNRSSVELPSIIFVCQGGACMEAECPKAAPFVRRRTQLTSASGCSAV